MPIRPGIADRRVRLRRGLGPAGCQFTEAQNLKSWLILGPETPQILFAILRAGSLRSNMGRS